MGLKSAKGSLSLLTWATETTYGTAPAAGFGMPFVNEGLDMTVNSIVSQEIRPDRTVPGVRGGNRAAGGNVSTDFGIRRFAPWWQHLLGGTTAYSAGITVPTIATATVYVRGDYVKNVAGTNQYLCTIGGTSPVSGFDLSHTSGEFQQTTGVRWLFVSVVASNPINRFVITAGPALPTGGLTVEKGIVGGDVDLYQAWVGGRINSARITIPQDGLVQTAWELLFLKSLANTTTAGVASTAVADAPIMGFESMLSLVGAENYDLRDGNFEIMNNISATDYRIGSRDRKTVTEARREIKGQFTAYFTDATLFNLFINETSFVGLFSFYRSNGDFISFEFPECKFFGTPIPKIAGPGTISSTFDLSVFKELSAYDCKVTIKTLQTQPQMQSVYGMI